jgi:hypothetical protein
MLCHTAMASKDLPSDINGLHNLTLMTVLVDKIFKLLTTKKNNKIIAEKLSKSIIYRMIDN